MERYMRYSDRKAFAERGTPDPLGVEVSDRFRNALASVTDELAKARGPFGIVAHGRMSMHYEQEFDQEYPIRVWIQSVASDDDVLDFVELLVEHATLEYHLKDYGRGCGWPDIEDRLNGLFFRNRLAYQLERGKIRRIGSPALDEYVVLPALQVLHRPGWEHAERAFREALSHQRGGPEERDDALTAATSALEAAMKAAGLRGDRLGPLAKDFKKSNLVPGGLASAPEALETLLNRSGAIRNRDGDAHGKAPEANGFVPEELVDLSIYWTGAFVNYLVAAVERQQSEDRVSDPA